MFSVLAVAIAHETRQAIVEILDQRNSISMGELSLVLDVAPSTATYHVDILERAGLAVRKRLGTSVYVESGGAVEIVVHPRNSNEQR